MPLPRPELRAEPLTDQQKAVLIIRDLHRLRDECKSAGMKNAIDHAITALEMEIQQ